MFIGSGSPIAFLVVTDVETSQDALRDLRRTRRHNRLVDVHWVDALYRVYIAALAAVIFVGFASSRLPAERLSETAAAPFLVDGPRWLGLFVAFVVALGFRSGGRGGPLVLEGPVVVHELQAPLNRKMALRSPAIRQIRFSAFAGAVFGAIVGELASRRLPVNVAASIAMVAVTFALTAVAAVGVGMITSGHRVRWWQANMLALFVIGWSAADWAIGIDTSPLTMLAKLAFWPLETNPIAFVGVLAVIAIGLFGIRSVGGISIEAALRRASLVSQLRFAVTLQDVRTVVLLRRQLAQERPRLHPWIRVGHRGRLPPVWRRDWAGFLRFPLPRLLRMFGLAVVAGIALGFTWRGTTPAVIVAGLALYLAAFDACEPIAQEVDHPTRWESFPDDPGRVLLNHLPATIVMTLIICGIAASVSLFLVPLEVVRQLLFVVVLAALASAVGGAVGTAQGAPDTAHLAGLGPDMMGFFMLGRMVMPPLLTLLALLPLLAAGSDAGSIDTNRVANAESYVIFALMGAFLWLRYRKPRHP